MLHLLIQTISAAIATVGFSLLFGVPARYYPSCALIGGISWLAYLVLVPYSSVTIATFAATVIVILMSRWFAVRERCPVTIFLISGIIPLVPGGGLYYTMDYLINGDYPMFSQVGLQTAASAAAIAVGASLVTSIVRMLPKRRRTGEKRC